MQNAAHTRTRTRTRTHNQTRARARSPNVGHVPLERVPGQARVEPLDAQPHGELERAAVEINSQDLVQRDRDVDGRGAELRPRPAVAVVAAYKRGGREGGVC